MNILVAGRTLPWPPISGARLRLGHVLDALTRLGEVDLFVIVDQEVEAAGPARAAGQRSHGASPPVPGLRVEVARWPPVGEWAGRLAWLLGGDRPLALAMRETRSVRDRFTAWARPAYDLAWFSRAESHALLGDLVRGPAIVDLDDLEDRKIALRPAAHPSAGPGIRRWLAGGQGRLDARRWGRLQARIARAADAVTVCSEADKAHLSAPNTVVIPNGYDDPARPVGREAVGDPPVVGFAGFFPYPPNLDAARWLVHEIAPRLRRRIPQAQVRLIGQATEEVRAWHRPPDVEVTGVVPDMAAALVGVDVVLVPVRFGGGTRIKILEAFAHRIPVVSTGVGAQGLDVQDGREVVLAEGPDALAEACARVLTHGALRRSLVEAAHRMFVARYRWADIQDAIVALAARVAGGAGAKRACVG